MKIKLFKTLCKLRFLVLVIGFQALFMGNTWAASNDSYFSKNKVEDRINQQITISGKVTSSEDGIGLPGVTIMVKNNKSIYTITDFDGLYNITVNDSEAILVFTYMGYRKVERKVKGFTEVNVSMVSDLTNLDEVVVIGYGTQKKETLVGAVSQVDSKTLQRTGGVSSVGAALTGNLPGLITTSSSGAPGDENPQIFIRGQNSWNGNSPLILVDGVERPEFFNQMDVGSVESISVLKDASATAVFGSRGANGVIIVTTKRGLVGKAEVSARVSTTMKTVSKLPGKYDSYKAIGVRNQAIERDLLTDSGVWSQIIPQQVREKYLNPTSLEEYERYPNVDWQDILFKDFALSHNANVSVRGGTDLTKYFASVDFQTEDDMFKEFKNDRGYPTGFDYNRLNFRSNLDFNLSPTTKLKVDLGGIYSVRKTPWGYAGESNYWSSAYSNPPDAYLPRYSDGQYGFAAASARAGSNSVRDLTISGVQYNTTATIATNFVLEQSLDMITEGLKFRGALSVDNRFVESGRGVDDRYNDIGQKYIVPETGATELFRPYDTNTNYDFFGPTKWARSAGGVGGAQRKTFYQLKLNYDKTINENHNISLMGLMSRQQNAYGSEIPRYREDWVFKTLYNYKGKYLLDYSGSYNGSEKFSPDYRFSFFSSGGLGWVVSKENFMKSIKSIDLLKLRASYGEVGDDGAGGRFLYQDQWSLGGASRLGIQGEGGEASAYEWYKQNVIGNTSVRWETVYKYNAGIELNLFKRLIEFEFDVFKDDRKDVLMTYGRAVPSYFGASAPAANLGHVITKGYEIQLGLNHTFKNDIRVWADFAMTHAIDEVIDRDDPELMPDYQKNAGFQLGQYRNHISSGYFNSWDELYGSTPYNTDDASKLPGNYNLLDYNADGIINDFDRAPYGYSSVPQNTYNTSIGFDWKGISVFAQFYGVNNVTRDVTLRSLSDQRNLVYEEGSYWSNTNMNADSPLPRWTTTYGNASGNRYLYDASYIRLKNAEIAYRFSSEDANKLGLSSLRIFLNGNNLFLWSKMPDDRESNFSGSGGNGAYPLTRRFNLGLNITF